MKKLAAIFAIAVIVPSLVLAWLAMRSLRDQEIVVHSQSALLHQTATDSLAADLNTFMDDVRLYFSGLVDEMVEEQGAEKLSANFDTELKARWGQALVGCVVNDQGQILSPPIDTTDPDAQEFLQYNRLFLSNKTEAEVYSAKAPLGNYIAVEEAPAPASFPRTVNQPAPAAAPEPSFKAQAEKQSAALEKANSQSVKKKTAVTQSAENILQSNVAVANSKLRSSQQSRRSFKDVNDWQIQQQQLDVAQFEAKKSQGQAAPLSIKKESENEEMAAGAITQPLDDLAIQAPQKSRIVSPYVQIGHGEDSGDQILNNSVMDSLGPYVNATPWSSIEADNAGLQEIMGDRPEGALARFLQDGLHVLLWVRHPSAPGKVFWAELDLDKIRERLSEIVDGAAFFQENSDDVSLALLNAEGDVVAQTRKGFTTDWRHPFVASEVGEILPHWEVAAYWVDPEAITKTAKTARLTLWLLVPILLAAIGFGSVLIFRDINREMFLARQKTDFVSNVSHELKTPLTSIRMFSDLLSSAKQIENGKRTEYSGIISREAARLTRLINNLLDFSRMDRGDRKYNFEEIDAVELARETADNYRMHLEADGCELEFHNANGKSAWINGDRDALSQVLLNLLSNADKYACDGKTIELEVATPDSETVEIRVLDRGPGIRRKDAARVFEKFYRADDSLATGIQGSGLGLTLARQIAQGHGGDLSFRNRDGGGSCFAVSLPILKAT